MNKTLVVIYLTVILDATGIGIIFPVLPSLLREVTHTDSVAFYIGLLSTAFAIMQFIFAPMLGALSDRVGRRPVLLLALGGAAINYLFLCVSSTFALLLIGRAVAGITGASLSVAMACLTDISTPGQRARRFGLFNAMFGVGFIIDPVLGGLLGDYGVRLPFLAAALLNGANFLLATGVLSETRIARPAAITRAAFNPLLPFRWLFSMTHLVPVVLTFFVLSFAGEACAICWTLWGQDAFQWNGFQVGLSLGLFGLFQALIQTFLPGPVARTFGERNAVLFGLACACCALCVMAFAREGWVALAVLPVFTLGSMGTPALQALATRLVEPGRQGQFQGILSSAISLSAVIAPLFFSSFYFTFRQTWPGAVWLAAMSVNLLAVPLMYTASSGRVGRQRSPYCGTRFTDVFYLPERVLTARNTAIFFTPIIQTCRAAPGQLTADSAAGTLLHPPIPPGIT